MVINHVKFVNQQLVTLKTNQAHLLLNRKSKTNHLRLKKLQLLNALAKRNQVNVVNEKPKMPIEDVINIRDKKPL